MTSFNGSLHGCGTNGGFTLTDTTNSTTSYICNDGSVSTGSNGFAQGTASTTSCLGTSQLTFQYAQQFSGTAFKYSSITASGFPAACTTSTNYLGLLFKIGAGPILGTGYSASDSILCSALVSGSSVTFNTGNVCTDKTTNTSVTVGNISAQDLLADSSNNTSIGIEVAGTQVQL
jgi:hypothetical protein